MDNTRLSKTDSGNPLKQWQPKKQSFDDFNTSFKLHMQLNGIPGPKWGMHLLTYLPETAKQSFLKGKEINSEVCSYAAVTRHCQDHQLAHTETESQLRAKLWRDVKHYNSATGKCIPVDDYLAEFDAVANKCKKEIDEATKIFLCRNGLHFAIQEKVQVDSQTREDFTSYAALKAAIVALGDGIPKAIAD
jgi:hypothetical protein